jgi:sulfoquinovosyltransferase
MCRLLSGCDVICASICRLYYVGEELSTAFASCDIFVMPSDTETLGFVVMEALASGLPTVGVNAGGVVDIIEHEKTGFLAQNDENMADFSARVTELAVDTTKRRNMGAAAVQWAQGWSWKAATMKLRNVQYRKAIQLFRARNENGRHLVEVEEAVMNHGE